MWAVTATLPLTVKGIIWTSPPPVEAGRWDQLVTFNAVQQRPSAAAAAVRSVQLAVWARVPHPRENRSDSRRSRPERLPSGGEGLELPPNEGADLGAVLSPDVDRRGRD